MTEPKPHLDTVGFQLADGSIEYMTVDRITIHGDEWELHGWPETAAERSLRESEEHIIRSEN